MTYRSKPAAAPPSEAATLTTGNRTPQSVAGLLGRCQGPGNRSQALFAFDLDEAIETAWNHPRHWVRVQPPDGGVTHVLCSPRTSKAGLNYWLWGYRLTTRSQVWRASRRPLT